MGTPATPTTPECVEALGAILAAFEPEPLSVFLHGSRARGDARPDSDWDFWVMLPDGWTAEARAAMDGDRLWFGPGSVADAVGETLPFRAGVVAYELNRVVDGSGWCLFRHVASEGVLLWGQPASGYGFAPDIAGRSASRMLDFAADRLLWAAADLDGYRDDRYPSIRTEYGGRVVLLSRVAGCRALDAWMCLEGKSGLTTKWLQSRTGEWVGDHEPPAELASAVQILASALGAAGYEDLMELDAVEELEFEDESPASGCLAAARDVVAAVRDAFGGRYLESGKERDVLAHAVGVADAVLAGGKFRDLLVSAPE